MARLSLVLDPLDHIRRIDPFIRRDFFRPVDGTKQADISKGKGISKAVLKHIGDGGVTARFETGDDLAARPSGTQGFKGTGNGGGMMERSRRVPQSSHCRVKSPVFS